MRPVRARSDRCRRNSGRPLTARLHFPRASKVASVPMIRTNTGFLFITIFSWGPVGAKRRTRTAAGLKCRPERHISIRRASVSGCRGGASKCHTMWPFPSVTISNTRERGVSAERKLPKETIPSVRHGNWDGLRDRVQPPPAPNALGGLGHADP
jgi:hypothetical protein